jgi:hypothetical protein
MSFSKKRKTEDLRTKSTQAPATTSSQDLTKPSTNSKSRRSMKQEPMGFLSLPAEIRQDILFRALLQTWRNEGIRWPHYEVQSNGKFIKRETISWADGLRVVHEDIVEDVDFVEKKVEEKRKVEARPWELIGRDGKWGRV